MQQVGRKVRGMSGEKGQGKQQTLLWGRSRPSLSYRVGENVIKSTIIIIIKIRLHLNANIWSWTF